MILESELNAGEMVMYRRIQSAATAGDKNAAAWLRGEGYIHITEAPHEAVFTRFTNQDGRHSPRARQWVKEVLSRAEYRCEQCESSGELQAHHIQHWIRCPELRFELSNGLALCVKCHQAAHPGMPILSSSRLRNEKDGRSPKERKSNKSNA